MNIRKAVDYSTMFATLESVMKADLPQSCTAKSARPSVPTRKRVQR